MAKLFIRPDGSIEGLYTDTIPLRDLGRLNIARATNVEFDVERQEWLVTLPDGKEVFSDPSREEALNWEQKFCEACLYDGFRVSQ
ncbi:hypothetical protein [Bacteroides sp.]|uniref:hypothetical protein n=1 Tax=Bacteroides sp. TaxID=29523 RepID=UPI00262D6EE5|nr:hypothetical protein [Bacteroides sp.]MDD3040448.1 hypothetical protein [Bacteroides sp.]